MSENTRLESVAVSADFSTPGCDCEQCAVIRAVAKALDKATADLSAQFPNEHIAQLATSLLFSAIMAGVARNMTLGELVSMLVDAAMRYSSSRKEVRVSTEPGAAGNGGSTPPGSSTRH